MLSNLLLSALAVISASDSFLASAAPQTLKRSDAGYGYAPKPNPYPPTPPRHCPPVSGTFNITRPTSNYYAENFDWDTKRCLLYVSFNPSVSVLIYDPYTTEQTVVTFPGISGPSNHIGGVDYDARSDKLFITIGNAETWNTFGGNVLGPDMLIKWDPETRKSVWTANLGPFQDDIRKKTGQKVGGFQDQAEDACGNSYTVAAFGNLIAKVDGKSGAVEPFYVPPKGELNATAFGMLGIVSVQQQNKLIVSDAAGKRFVSFDISGSNKEINPKPVNIRMSKLPPKYNILCDGLYVPPKYGEKIFICSDIFFNGKIDDGAIVVYGSKDGWVSGEYLGAIVNNKLHNGLARGAAGTATVQMGDNIFVNEDYFLDGDSKYPSDDRNRTGYPVIDITTEVDNIVKEFLNKY